MMLNPHSNDDDLEGVIFENLPFVYNQQKINLRSKQVLNNSQTYKHYQIGNVLRLADDESNEWV